MAGANPQQVRCDEWRCIGLCHGGRTVGSVALHYDPIKGKAWLKCFAECDLDVTLAAFNMTRAGLWDEPFRRDGIDPPRRTPRPIRDLPEPQIFDPAPHGWSPASDTWMPKFCGHTKIAEYLYRDEVDRILFGVARCTNKCFAQWRPAPDSRSGRRWALAEKDENENVIAEVRRVPFRLRQLLTAATDGLQVLLVEGEKDVLAVVEAGAVATTVPGGASKWRPEFAQYFAGADIRIIADRDVPGRRHSELLVRALSPVAARIEVAIAKAGKDAADHLAGGHDLDDFTTVWTPKNTKETVR
jgi:hypothetical protein